MSRALVEVRLTYVPTTAREDSLLPGPPHRGDKLPYAIPSMPMRHGIDGNEASGNGVLTIYEALRPPGSHFRLDGIRTQVQPFKYGFATVDGALLVEL